ncbi:MAG: hypothetical protein WCB57_09470 [Pseudonocardiaceae bacterium]
MPIWLCAAVVARVAGPLAGAFRDVYLRPFGAAQSHETIDGLAGLMLGVISAYSWWQHAGRPPHERYGVTVTSAGQSVWLDIPTQPVAPRD